MLSQSVCRSARTGCSHHPNHLATSATRHVSSTPPSIASAASFQQRGPTVSKHQRRPSSSSSASSPPSGQRPPPSDPVEQMKAATRDSSDRRLRYMRRKVNDKIAAVKARHDAFANVPAVPSTEHLQLSDVKVSDFFALHRPISVTSTFPPQSTDAAGFEKLFTTKHRPSDVIYTISSTAAAIEGRSGSGDQSQINWQTVSQQDQSITHLDGPPQPQSLEQLIKQFRPFNPPPSPVPFSEVQAPEMQAAKVHPGPVHITPEPAEKAPSPPAPPRRTPSRPNPNVKDVKIGPGFFRSMDIVRNERRIKQPGLHRLRRMVFTTHVQVKRMEVFGGVVFWYPYSDREPPGAKKLYSPSLNHSRRKLARNKAIHEARRKSLLAKRRAASKQEKYSVQEYLLISVKRQRKLKMKKHKFKKLMRRTRNLRIREGRN